MLARPNRLTSGEDFRRALRQGRRAAARTLVVHLASSTPADPHDPRAGLVVSKAVGNAVTRNRIKRRLRHALRGQLGVLPEGSLLVVRALPLSAAASYTELSADLADCLGRALAGRERRR